MKKSSRILMLWAFFLFMLPAWAVDLGPSNGIQFSQISYVGPPDIANTPSGWMEVDLNLVRNTTGIAAGYVNVITPTGWVVRNLPVLSESVYPYSRINTRFDLGVQLGTPVTQLTATVSYTEALLTSYAAAPALAFAVAPFMMNIGGADGVTAGGPVAPPTFTDILFSNPSSNDAIIQYDHPNEQAAANQCAPMSIANSLKYLKDTQGLQLPHEHTMGLKGDNSLVGQIDTAGNRNVTSRTVGTGQWLLESKLKYLAANNLGASVSTSQWGSYGPETGAGDTQVSVNGSTASATGKGDKVKIDELMQALREGQNCEMVYYWDGPPAGAHAVDVVGAGFHNGQPWLLHTSDVVQSHQALNGDAKGAGPRGMQFEYLGPPDADGNYKTAKGRNIAQVVCEKPVPPPVTETITQTNDPAGHSCCVTPPPPTVRISRFGSTMSMMGTASWLPLRGTFSPNGSFSLASTATVAGFSNVTSSFIGSLQGSNYIGTITVGAKGELPENLPISWQVSIPRVGEATSTALRFNGFRHHLEPETSSELLRPSITVKAGPLAGQSGDWWLAAVDGAGAFSHFDLGTMSWLPGLLPTFTGPLFDIPYFPLPYLSLPSGSYDFYFGFDSVPNGALNMEALTFERLRATVP